MEINCVNIVSENILPRNILTQKCSFGKESFQRVDFNIAKNGAQLKKDHNLQMIFDWSLWLKANALWCMLLVLW